MFWFGGWEPVARVVVVAVLGHLALVVLLRVSLERTLSRLDAFDFVVTVAIGAAFGRVLTAREVALAEAVTAFVVLVLMQYAVASIQLRSRRVARLLGSRPALLWYRGEHLDDAMRRERVTREELDEVVRLQGLGSLARAEAVVMENDGEFSVMGSSR